MLGALWEGIKAVGKVIPVVGQVVNTAETIGNALGIGKPVEPSASPATATAVAAANIVPTQFAKDLPIEIQNVLNRTMATTAEQSAARDSSASRIGRTARPARTATPQPASSNPANPTNASTKIRNGVAEFENANYIITAGDNNKVTIFNKNTGKVYEAVGDKNMKIDGQAGFAAQGTLSLMLDDGTKVTLERADDAKGGSNASKMTITNGAYGAQIKGIDTNTLGDLTVREFAGQGRALDNRVQDGVVIEENSDASANDGAAFVAKGIEGHVTKVSTDYLSQANQTNYNASNLGRFDKPGMRPNQLNSDRAFRQPANARRNPTQQANNQINYSKLRFDVGQSNQQANRSLQMAQARVNDSSNVKLSVSIKPSPSNSASMWA